jgi:hypothetical protein
MSRKRAPLLSAAGILLLALLACRPVMAIGWEELLAIALIIAFLLGPVLFRLARAWVKFQESLKKERD